MQARSVSTLSLTLACCLAGQMCQAQRTAVAPLKPLAPVVQSPVGPLGGVQFNFNRKPAPPVASGAAQSVRYAWPQPVYLLNSRIIVSVIDEIINPRDIAKIDVYKVPAGPTPVKWRSLTEHGIIDIQLKSGVKLKLKTKSLAAIRRQLKLSGLVNFELTGMRIEDESLRIADKAIAGFDISRTDAETIVNILLVPPKPAPPLPPGSIRIRGVAGI